MSVYRHKVVSLLGVFFLVVNLLPAYAPVTYARTAPLPVFWRSAPVTSVGGSVDSTLPDWFAPPAAFDKNSTTPVSFGTQPLGSKPAQPLPTDDRLTLLGIEVMPSHFVENAVALAPLEPRPESSSASTSAADSASAALPGWFTPRNQPPSGPAASPPLAPLKRDIPLSLLTVNVTGPDVASLGSPSTFGEVYTAVIRNTSSETAYGIYLTATHRSFFVHDGGDQIISSTGTIPFNLATTASSITWTPVTTYNLAPSEAITLNFRLRATCGAQSGQRLEVGIRYNADAPPDLPVELNTGGLNVTTGRGNLVIKKEPALQNLGTPDFGRPITWIVTVQNTGLGTLYDAIISDTGGINLSQPGGDLVPSVTIPMLDVNEVQTFTVVGTVEACNFTNVAQGAWPCGNLVGDATYANPISSTVSVLFTPDVPNVDVQVSPDLTFPYCNLVTRTVTITIDNTGGPAGDFRLDSTFESDSFLEVIPSSISGGWAYTPSNGIFAYTDGSPAGTIPGVGGSLPVTLSFDVRPQSTPVCSAGSGDVAFTPLYNDICTGNPFTGNPLSLAYQYAQGEAPTLDISKSGPDVVASGEVFTYQITIAGTNPVNINGGINITDVLPSQFELRGPITPSTGVANTNGQTVTWNFDPPRRAIHVYRNARLSGAGGSDRYHLRSQPDRGQRCRGVCRARLSRLPAAQPHRPGADGD